jgi:hypothetical protein
MKEEADIYLQGRFQIVKYVKALLAMLASQELTN